MAMHMVYTMWSVYIKYVQCTLHTLCTMYMV